MGLSFCLEVFGNFDEFPCRWMTWMLLPIVLVELGRYKDRYNLTRHLQNEETANMKRMP